MWWSVTGVDVLRGWAVTLWCGVGLLDLFGWVGCLILPGTALYVYLGVDPFGLPWFVGSF